MMQNANKINCLSPLSYLNLYSKDGKMIYIYIPLKQNSFCVENSRLSIGEV